MEEMNPFYDSYIKENNNLFKLSETLMNQINHMDFLIIESFQFNRIEFLIEIKVYEKFNYFNINDYS